MNKYMKEALEEAKLSYIDNEVPVGAVIVKGNKIIAKAHNMSYMDGINSHAEILAINKAIKKLNDWRLTDCELYVTLEPCPMCAGAIIQSRIKKVIVGSKSNIKSNSKIIASIFNNSDYYHAVDYVYLDDSECSKIISDFFKQKR